MNEWATLNGAYRRCLKSLQTSSERCEFDGDVIAFMLGMLSEFTEDQADFVVGKFEEFALRIRTDHGDRGATPSS